MYEDCDNAYADKVYNIPKVHPSYKPDLDADHDGVACEVAIAGGTNLADYKPTATQTATQAAPTELPVTGTDASVGGLMAIGLATGLLGSTLVLGVRRRYRGAHR